MEEAGHRSVALRVMKQQRVATTATSDLSEAGLKRCVEDALELVELSEKDPSSMVEYCDVRLSSLKDYGFSWPNPETRQSILDCINQLVSEFDFSEERVLVHADYAPGNLIWGGGVLTPIDFAMVHAGGFTLGRVWDWIFGLVETPVLMMGNNQVRK